MTEQTDSGDDRGWVAEILSAERFGAASDALKRRVKQEQLRTLFAINRYAYRTSLVFAGLAAVYFLGRVPLALLLGWFALVCGVALVRYLIARQFFSIHRDTLETRWSVAAVVAMACQAAAWAMLPGFVFLTGQSGDMAFSVFVLCALGFGGFAALGFHFPAYLAFALPIFGAIWWWLGQWDSQHLWWIGLTVVVASLAIFDSAVNTSRMVRGALLLGFEREKLIRRLSEEKERVQVTLRSIGDGVMTTDTDGKVTFLNPVAERLTGWRSSEASQHAIGEVLQLLDESTGELLQDPIRQCLGAARPLVIDGDTVLIGRSGDQEYSVEVTMSPILDADRRALGMVVVIHDVTELRGMARAMSYQANHDPLTGLVNRREFEVRLWQALETARAQRLKHAMCYLDLDQFKLVNDTCGHVAGDELLKQLSHLLSRRVRETDTLARLGGDEFGLLVNDCTLEQAREMAESLCMLVRDFRFAWEDKIFTIGVSIGLVPVDGSSTPTDLLSAADAACYVAKDLGRNRVHIVHPNDRELAHRHGEMQWTTRIQRGLDADLFRLRIQRIEPLDPGEPLLAEFLIYMEGNNGERIPPGMFLPAAERFNLMPAIDRRVVEMVCQRVANQANEPQLVEVGCFNINLSGQSLSDESFLDFVERIFDQTGVDPTKLCFEITETAVIANLARAQRFINALREKGCHFALDDFGSGLSSFGYLRTLPVDYLKIDGQFVRNISDDPIDHSMVEAINQVGHVMGIRTIAEFVEDEATLSALRALGVDYGQGYALHRPELLDPPSQKKIMLV